MRTAEVEEAEEVREAEEKSSGGGGRGRGCGFAAQIWSLKRGLFRAICRVLHAKWAYLHGRLQGRDLRATEDQARKGNSFTA